MSKPKITLPFFIFNPKSYLYGQALLDLTQLAEDLAQQYEMTIFVTGPYAHLYQMSQLTDKAKICAQHLDGIEPGRGMGAALADSLKAVGVQASFLNHAEHPLSLAELTQAIDRAHAIDLVTIVCADSLKEAEAIAMLHPDIILCEPTELIGTGQTSGADYIQQTNQAIHSIDPDILVMQAAGISSAQDVFETIRLGADGTGCTSGIVKADNPEQMLKEMVEAAYQAYQTKEDSNEVI
ncbi:triose-phosphate isomerase [Ignavigranum ruoffiae]